MDDALAKHLISAPLTRFQHGPILVLELRGGSVLVEEHRHEGKQTIGCLASRCVSWSETAGNRPTEEGFGIRNYM